MAKSLEQFENLFPHFSNKNNILDWISVSSLVFKFVTNEDKNSFEAIWDHSSTSPLSIQKSSKSKANKLFSLS